MVLHMLRLMLGDEVFFKGVQRFYLSSRFRKVGSEDFRYAMQEESGRDLQRFFERWIYNAALPQVTFSSRVRSRGLGSGGGTAFRADHAGNLRPASARDARLCRRPNEGRTVVINDRIVEVHEALDGALRSVSISKRDVSLVDFKDAPSPGK